MLICCHTRTNRIQQASVKPGHFCTDDEGLKHVLCCFVTPCGMLLDRDDEKFSTVSFHWSVLALLMELLGIWGLFYTF